MNRNKQTIGSSVVGYTLVITASFLFGFNGNLSRILFDEGISPVTLVEFRMIIGGACLMLVMLTGWRSSLKLARRHWLRIIFFGLSLAMVTYTYFEAIKRLPLAVALVIQFTASAWMTLGDAIWQRRMPNRFILIALCLTFGGVILLTGVWHQSLSGLDSIGLLFAVLAVLAYISYLLAGQKVGRDLPSLTTTSYGAIVAAIFWLIVQPPWAIPSSTWTPAHLGLIFLVGTIGMAIPFTMVLGSLRRLEATQVSIAAMFELVAAGVIAYFWLGQHLDIYQIGGCILVMVGIAILQIEARMK